MIGMTGLVFLVVSVLGWEQEKNARLPGKSGWKRI